MGNYDLWTVPETIAEIAEESMKNVTALTSIRISGSFAEIGESAFYGKSLKYAELEEGIKSIGPKAFEGCKELKNVVLPDGLKEIGN